VNFAFACCVDPEEYGLPQGTKLGQGAVSESVGKLYPSRYPSRNKASRISDKAMIEEIAKRIEKKVAA